MPRGPQMRNPAIDSPVMLARQVANGEQSAEISEWLRGGMVGYLRSAKKLDTALGLDRASRTKQRDRALLELADLLDVGRGLWVVAGRIENAIERFEVHIWPNARLELRPNLGEIDQTLFRIFAADVRQIRGQEGLYWRLKKLNGK